MSSNIRIRRICTYCGKEFEARKTTSKTCSNQCANYAYKARKRAEKIEVSDKGTERVKSKPLQDIKANEFLTLEEAAILIGVSLRTLYRIIERGELVTKKLGHRTIIRRQESCRRLARWRLLDRQRR